MATAKKPTTKKVTAKKPKTKKSENTKIEEVVTSTEYDEYEKARKNGSVKNDTTGDFGDLSRVELLTTETDETPKRYYVQFYLERSPLDHHIGTIYWSDLKKDILIESLDGQYASQIEGMMEGDLMLKDGTFVSRYEHPKDWVLNAPNANLGFNMYAKFFVECVDLSDETE